MAGSGTLAESVAAALRHAIFHRTYAQGERLIELNIAQEMHVSQNTVRDALRLLEQDGLVRKQARYGTYVRSYSPDEAAEIYALWTAVESLALRWVLVNIDDRGIASLQTLLDDFRSCVTQGQNWQALDLRFAIHQQLMESAQRPLTCELLRGLHNQARLLEAGSIPATSRMQETQLDSYVRLLGAITRREDSRAQEILTHCILGQAAP